MLREPKQHSGGHKPPPDCLRPQSAQGQAGCVGTMLEEAELIIDLCHGEKSSGAITAVGERIGLICVATQRAVEIAKGR